MVVEGLTCKTPSGDTLRVREVWQDNLAEEMELIRNLVDEYPFLAMDTEFPGVVARPVGNFKNSGEYHYQTLRCGAAARAVTPTDPALQARLFVAQGRLLSAGATWTCSSSYSWA